MIIMKKQKCLKTWVRIFRVRIYWLGIFLGKFKRGGGEELEVWKFFGRVFPNIVHFSFS